MTIYTFEGADNIVEIKSSPIEDFEIRVNNDNLQTGDKFVSIAKLVGEKKSLDLRTKLAEIYEGYLKNEFGKMGYILVKKNGV